MVCPAPRFPVRYHPIHRELKGKQMMQRDRYGLPLSTASEAAASAYRDGFDRVLAAWNGAEAALDRAVAADPHLALAHIARARMHAVFGRGAEARACAARARDLAAKTTERERGHVHVIASAVEGKAAQALTDAERHLDAYPRDALVLVSLLGAFGLYAFSGRNDHDEARLSICRRLAAHYGDDWWFLSYLGCSNLEAGCPGVGIEQAQRAPASCIGTVYQGCGATARKPFNSPGPDFVSRV